MPRTSHGSWPNCGCLPSQSTVLQLGAESPSAAPTVPMTARISTRAKDSLRYAHSRAVVAQHDQTLKNYAKRLLSKQVARDVERLTVFLCDLVRRGVQPHLAKRCLDLIAFAIDEATPRAINPGPWDGLSMAELHRLETEAQWKREAAESSFMHNPTIAHANALLNADDEYEFARQAMRRRALKVAAS